MPSVTKNKALIYLLELREIKGLLKCLVTRVTGYFFIPFYKRKEKWIMELTQKEIAAINDFIDLVELAEEQKELLRETLKKIAIIIPDKK